jgi:hypothetical protein|tara:strand:- start:1252 stop:1791 length:540 start_codon:yes stop_codon:yes gene_type:complete
MSSVKVNNHWGNLQIVPYIDNNIDPLMPILQQEFPDWNSKRIKAYMQLVTRETPKISGVLAAKNESGYYVGCLIYTYQKIDENDFEYSSNIDSKKTFDIFVIENINSCIPILQKRIFLSLIDTAIGIAESNKCDYIELPTLATESYDLVRNKYEGQIQDPKKFRTYLKLSKSLKSQMQL